MSDDRQRLRETVEKIEAQLKEAQSLDRRLRPACGKRSPTFRRRWPANAASNQADGR